MRKFEMAVCSCCEGFGKVDHPAFSNGFTSDEWERMDFDEREDYLSGTCDVVCPDCKGRGLVEVPNLAAMTFGEKRQLVCKRRQARWDAEYDAECAAERWMGA